MKKILLTLFAVILLSQGVSAAESKYDYSKTEKFTTTSSDFSYPAEEEITVDRQKYNLKNIEYKILKEERTTREIQVTEEKQLASGLSEQKCEAPNESIQFQYNGETLTGTLAEIKYNISETQDERAEEITEKVECGYSVQKPKVNGTYSIKYEDTLTGDILDVELQLQKIEQTGSKSWVNDFVFYGTVYNYGASHYVFNDVSIPHDTTFQFKGFENDILKHLGLSTQDYTIDNAQWYGDVFADADGTAMRKVKLTGKRYAAQWVATYSGTHIFPKTETYEAVAIYTAPYMEETGDVEYTVNAVMGYDYDYTGTIISSVIIIVFVITVVAVLTIISKKKKRKREI